MWPPLQEKRDLTLGAGKAPAVEKKKFVPNLNVTRNIKKETPDQAAAKSREEKGKRDRKENKQEKREKHHKDRPALIQTIGSIFADGKRVFR